MTETKETHAVRSGALHSSLTIELHTHYAISLWNGRRNESSKKNKPVIISMPRFFLLAGRISHDSLIDNPYADMAMLALETKLASAHDQMQAALAELEATLSGVPAQIHLSDIASIAPLNIGVYSRTPLGYRCVWLLVGYDQLVMKALQAHHYALISRQQCDGFLKKGGTGYAKSTALSSRTVVLRLLVTISFPKPLLAGKLLPVWGYRMRVLCGVKNVLFFLLH